MKTGKKVLRALLCVLLSAVLAAGIECLLSNYRYFQSKKYGGPVPLNESVAESDDSEKDDSGDYIRMKAGGVVNSISFDIYSETATQEKYSDIFIKLSFPGDEDNYHLMLTDRIPVGSQKRTHTYHLKQVIKAYAVEIKVDSPNGIVVISDIVVNPSFRFGFNFYRAGIIFAAILLPAAVFAFNLYNIYYEPEKKKHRKAAALTALVCAGMTVFSGVFILNTKTAEIAWPLENEVKTYNPYIQQFDAFKKGQLNIDVDPPEELAKLENPYDKQARKDIKCLWDRAYYNGKYYSYFGLGPVISLYTPYYLVRGALPCDRLLTVFCCAVAAFFFILSVFKWVEIFKKKIPFVFLIGGSVSALFSGMLFTLMRGVEPFYYLALLCALMFTCVFAFLIMCAFTQKKAVKRKILMILSGAAFGMAFLSRVNTVLAPAFITAAVIIVFIIKSFKEKAKFTAVISDLVCLAVPVLSAVSLAFIFNYLRFGSPLDFGTDYQLTVSDTSLNKLFVAGIPASVYYYFFERSTFRESFPFFCVGRGGVYPVAKDYVYIDDNCGVFAVPHNIALLTVPVYPLGKNKSPYELWAVIAGAGGVLAAAFIDFCLGGVIYRYTGDISFVTAFLSLVILLELVSALENAKVKTRTPAIAFETLVFSVFCISVIIASLLALTVGGNFSAMKGGVFETIKHTVCWWL
ncbi:MAG: hypothetical protein J5562_09175 [Clostridia bacterium]|nr:hypothetical protein [Clostridia bacterium]